MKKTRWQSLTLLLVIALVGFGCASSGGGGGDAAPSAPPVDPDYREEVGDNGLLTPRAILARYTEALGGEDALRSHQSATMKGKFSLAAMGIEGTVTIHAIAPNKTKMVIETAMGNIASGYDGTNAWSEDPFSGAQVLEGGAAAAAAAQSNFYGPLGYPDIYTSMETIEETEFNGEAAYKLMLVDATGGETKQYFSKESSLLIGQEAMQDGPTGSVEAKVTLSDYKEFGGVLGAMKTSIDAGGMVIENVIETVTHDDVDPASIVPPDSVTSQL